MASISFGLNRGKIDNGLEQITVGTLAVTTNDVELRWDATKGLTRREIIEIMDFFEQALEDGRFAGYTL